MSKQLTIINKDEQAKIVKETLELYSLNKAKELKDTVDKYIRALAKGMPENSKTRIGNIISIEKVIVPAKSGEIDRIVDGVKTSVPYKTDEKVIVRVKALNTLKTIIKNELND